MVLSSWWLGSLCFKVKCCLSSILCVGSISYNHFKIFDLIWASKVNNVHGTASNMFPPLTAWNCQHCFSLEQHSFIWLRPDKFIVINDQPISFPTWKVVPRIHIIIIGSAHRHLTFLCLQHAKPSQLYVTLFSLPYLYCVMLKGHCAYALLCPITGWKKFSEAIKSMADQIKCECHVDSCFDIDGVVLHCTFLSQETMSRWYYLKCWNVCE